MLYKNSRKPGRLFADLQPFAVEALEPRRLLAGSVDVAVVGGSLVITGDELGNFIVIDQIGLGDDEFRVASGTNTTNINEDASAKVFTGVIRDVRIQFRGGGDRVDVNLSTIPRDFRVDGGAGSNAVVLHSSHVSRNLKIQYGDAFDATALVGTIVGGNANIVNNNGGSFTDLRFATVIEGNLVVDSREGVDNFTMKLGVVEGNATVNSGNGASVIDFDTYSVERNLKIMNKAGLDLITLKDGPVQGSTRINNGNGGSTVIVRAVAFANDVSITNRAGADAVDMDGFSAERNLTVNNGVDGGSMSLKDGGVVGSTKLTSGDGFDNYQFDTVFFTKSATISGGSGGGVVDIVTSTALQNLIVRSTSVLDLTADDVDVMANFTVSTRAGGGSADISSSVVSGKLSLNGFSSIVIGLNSVVEGATALKTTLGNDTIQIDDSGFLGTFTIDSLGGPDVVQIEANGVQNGSMSQFADRVNIKMGGEGDILLIGLAGQIGNSAIFDAMVRLDGGSGHDIMDYLGHGNTFDSDPVVISIETEL